MVYGIQGSQDEKTASREIKIIVALRTLKLFSMPNISSVFSLTSFFIIEALSFLLLLF